MRRCGVGFKGRQNFGLHGTLNRETTTTGPIEKEEFSNQVHAIRYAGLLHLVACHNHPPLLVIFAQTTGFNKMMLAKLE